MQNYFSYDSEGIFIKGFYRFLNKEIAQKKIIRAFLGISLIWIVQCILTVDRCAGWKWMHPKSFVHFWEYLTYSNNLFSLLRYLELWWFRHFHAVISSSHAWLFFWIWAKPLFPFQFLHLINKYINKIQDEIYWLPAFMKSSDFCKQISLAEKSLDALWYSDTETFQLFCMQHQHPYLAKTLCLIDLNSLKQCNWIKVRHGKVLNAAVTQKNWAIILKNSFSSKKTPFNPDCLALADGTQNEILPDLC